MFRILAVSAAAMLLAGPVLAAGECSTAAASKFQPTTKLEDILKGDGLTVRQIKTEKGCYEVYAVDKAGKKVNVAYNAETLKKVANPEAGEG